MEALVASLAKQASLDTETTQLGDMKYMIAGATSGIASSSDVRAQFSRPRNPALINDQSIQRRLENLLESGYTVLALVVPESIPLSKQAFGKISVKHDRRQNKEALLASMPSSESTSFSSFAFSNSSPNFSGPLAGILPNCFATLSACQTTTRNCTGHGTCKLRFTDKDASSKGAPCYACACTSEVRTNKDGGKKTTVWGGPACQKKDVVAPFWLIAGFTVFMISLVSWGIGMLYSMGSEELPSVIGAGVSGVPRRS
jgi:hypothetical protein